MDDNIDKLNFNPHILSITTIKILYDKLFILHRNGKITYFKEFVPNYYKTIDFQLDNVVFLDFMVNEDDFWINNGITLIGANLHNIYEID